ncbi:MAG: sce7725 family protein [Rhizobiales bacterium]|nr:sce7725 family protein [Hyphomicrobiales bacterium]
MYHPYFRGKQFELITVRETAERLARSKFVPIIEPVKEVLSGLKRSLDAVCEAGGNVVVIVNPHHGDHSEDGEEISSLLKTGYLSKPCIAPGVLLKEDTTIEDIMKCCEKHKGEKITLIHAGFTQAKALAEKLGDDITSSRNIFFEAHCGKLYRKHFQGTERILLRDGFKRRRNADYPVVEEFSDLHVTYEEEGMNGFGDFLIVGDDYMESGGPAYAVAIHLTFIDPEKDDAMFIYHFVSETKDTPTDPAGKFGEALNSLVAKLDSGQSKLIETSAIKEFRDLHEKSHFPGLGYVKKLSMKHHIETIAAYFG